MPDLYTSSAVEDRTQVSCQESSSSKTRLKDECLSASLMRRVVKALSILPGFHLVSVAETEGCVSSFTVLAEGDPLGTLDARRVLDVQTLFTGPAIREGLPSPVEFLGGHPCTVVYHLKRFTEDVRPSCIHQRCARVIGVGN